MPSNTPLYRHGYPIPFVDRQKVLQTLYNKVQDKSKILTRKKVKTIDNSESTGVKITTTDGSVYSGDLVVGADGIHSIVRQEMARLNVDTGRDYLEEKCELLSHVTFVYFLLHCPHFETLQLKLIGANSILCNLLLCLRNFTPNSWHRTLHPSGRV